MEKNFRPSICIIGLGYVGLPLAVEFGKKFRTFGYDINSQRVQQLREFYDVTLELTKRDISRAKNLVFTHDPNDLAQCNTYVVTVPTPINKRNKPDLKPLKSACVLISGFLKKGDLVIFESTVFPGATREICVPLLEKSGLKFNTDFSCGYSPERINPGDRSKHLKDIIKVISASNRSGLNKVKHLYNSIITAGTHTAPSIEVAEAAKVIENTQRDINIALINELAVLFNKMNLNTYDVLKAANTKWNFLNFHPGLVGGHCIGVDPYYLTYRANQFGYKPKVILAGRKLNDSMANFICSMLEEKFNEKSLQLKVKKILILGLTFKEDCPDIRNSKVFDIIKNLSLKNAKIFAYDPFISNLIGSKNVSYLRDFPKLKFDAILICVGHKEFKLIGHKRIKSLLKSKGILFDIKNLFPNKYSDFSL